MVLPAQGSIILEHCNVNRVMNGWYRYTLPVLMLVTFNIYYSLDNLPSQLLGTAMVLTAVDDNNIPSQYTANNDIHSSTIPQCTKEAYNNSTYKSNWNLVNQADEILSYLVTKFTEIDAPIILMFGTMLHEFRNHTIPNETDPCLRPNDLDKDFDIAIFPMHFPYIDNVLKDEISKKFGWTFQSTDSDRIPMKQNLFGTIVPNNRRYGKKFQIDVYGFHCSASNDLIHFPWDVVTISKDGFLPVKRHKALLPIDEYRSSDTLNTNSTIQTIQQNSNNNHPVIYMPYNPTCLLTNIYGSDFMTPKQGKSSQAKFGSQHGRQAHGNPDCNSTLTEAEQTELERQLSFCSTIT